MKAPAARVARPRTRFRGAPPRADFQADHAAPPTSSSDPPRLVINGSTAGTSIAPRAGTWVFSSVGLVGDASPAKTDTHEMLAITITATRPARGGAIKRNEPIPSHPTFSRPPNR